MIKHLIEMKVTMSLLQEMERWYVTCFWLQRCRASAWNFHLSTKLYILKN